MEIKYNTKKIVTIAVFSALAYVISFMMQPIKIANFLSFEVKDSVITILGFVYGPAAAFLCTLISAVAEMFSFSNTGWIGCVMNIVSSASFACVASTFYKKFHSLKGAIAGLLVACLCSTSLMIAWNYILTPLYMKGVSRDVVVKMMLPVFLPFNLAKSVVNASVIMLIYKPIVNVLRKTSLVEHSKSNKTYKVNWGVIVVVCFFVITGMVVLYLINSSTAPSGKTKQKLEESNSSGIVEDNPSVEEMPTVGKGGYKHISHNEAKAIMDGDEPAVILDVRTTKEFDEGHIDGALNIPLETFDLHGKTLIEQIVMRKDQIIIVYCQSENSSKTAAQKLVDMGYINVKEFGNINEWKYGTVRE